MPDRIGNTVVSTSPNGEPSIAAPNAYEELLSNRPSGETFLAFAKWCEAAIHVTVNVKEKTECMKAGTLLPIRRGCLSDYLFLFQFKLCYSKNTTLKQHNRIVIF